MTQACLPVLPALRHYPDAFGEAVVQVAQTIAWAHAPPAAGNSCSSSQQGPQAWNVLFSRPVEDAWEDALMPDVVGYLRRKKGLNLPDEWPEDW